MSELKVNKISKRTGNNILLDDPVKLKNLTTTQRDALTGSSGDMIYNSTKTKVEYYTGSEWKEAGTPVLDGDLEFLGAYDFTVSNTGSGLDIKTLVNSGFLDVANYSNFRVIMSQIRNSGQYDMNLVQSARGSDGTSSLTGTQNYGKAIYRIRSNTGISVHHNNQTQHYASITPTEFRTDDDSQATLMFDLYNAGNNGMMPSLIVRASYRGNSGSGLMGHDYGMTNIENSAQMGAVRIGGYTSATFTMLVQVFGFKG